MRSQVDRIAVASRGSLQRHTRGMTLIEMMVVVVILSILTTLGITGYKKLVYQG